MYKDLLTNTFSAMSVQNPLHPKTFREKKQPPFHVFSSVLVGTSFFNLEMESLSSNKDIKDLEFLVSKCYLHVNKPIQITCIHHVPMKDYP